MDGKYMVILLADEDHNIELVYDGERDTGDDARNRAYEIQRCRPGRMVGIFKLAEIVTVEFSTELVS